MIASLWSLNRMPLPVAVTIDPVNDLQFRGDGISLWTLVPLYSLCLFLLMLFLVSLEEAIMHMLTLNT